MTEESRRQRHTHVERTVFYISQLRWIMSRFTFLTFHRTEMRRCENAHKTHTSACKAVTRGAQSLWRSVRFNMVGITVRKIIWAELKQQ